MRLLRLSFFATTVMLIVILTLPASSQTAVPQNTLWRVLVNDHDRMTVVNSIERAWFPDEGQMFYIPVCQPADTTPIYRLWNWSNGDHRDSLVPIDGSYTEWPEGCAWNPGTPLQGLSPIFEAQNQDTEDYTLIRPGEALPGYAKRMNLGLYGYKRFGLEKEVLVNVRGHSLSIDSNLVAGGGVWHWTWNGFQYLNLAGYQRGLHAEIIGLPGDSEDAQGWAYETGDRWSYFPDLGSNIHGAPLVKSATSSKTQTTLAVPLENDPDSWGGGQDTPVVWQDVVLGKELTLDFHGDANVVRYRMLLQSPATTQYDLNVSLAMYLRGIFTRYYTYDAGSDSLTEITSELSPCASSGYPAYPVIGGLIASDTTGNYAIGIYLSSGETPTVLAVRPRICPERGGYWEEPQSETSMSTVLLRASSIRRVTEGNSTLDRYIVTNNLANVRASMQKLYITGVR